MPEWITRYNDNDLAGDELHLFLEILEKNPSLKVEVGLDKELNEALADDDIIEFRRKIIASGNPKIRQSQLPRKLMLVAATLILMLIFELLLNHLCSRTESKGKESSEVSRICPKNGSGNDKQRNGLKVSQSLKPDGGRLLISSVKVPVNRIKLASNLIPDPQLEGLVGSNVRSFYFKLLSPSGVTHFSMKDTIRLSWEPDLEKPIKLIVTDNHGICVFETEKEMTNRIFFRASQFHSGLFYFKIIGNDDLLYLGKFYIE